MQVSTIMAALKRNSLMVAVITSTSSCVVFKDFTCWKLEICLKHVKNLTLILSNLELANLLKDSCQIFDKYLTIMNSGF